MIGTSGGAITRRGRTVHRSAGVVDHVHTRAPEARAVRFGHIPIESGESFVEVGVAVYVGKQRVVKPAVPHADPGWNLSHARLTWILDPVPVQIHVRLAPEVRLPGERPVLHIERLAALYRDGSAGSVHEQVVPLVEHRDAPTTVGNPRKREVPIGIALGGAKRDAVSISDGGPTGGVV